MRMNVLFPAPLARRIQRYRVRYQRKRVESEHTRKSLGELTAMIKDKGFGVLGSWGSGGCKGAAGLRGRGVLGTMA
jgi:hypothetical protein